MTREEISKVIEEILTYDGPDGHIDGSEVITGFIMAVLKGQGPRWFEEYQKQLSPLKKKMRYQP